MGGNLLEGFSSVEQGIPTKVVRRDLPEGATRVLLAHPGEFKTFEALKDAKLFLANDGYNSYYQWMIAEFGFKPEQRRPYGQSRPVHQDKRSAQRGYVTSEPHAVEKEGGFKPQVFVLADLGFDTYATTIETRTDLIEKKPAVVQCFVDASIKGWYVYLYGDNKAANALIKKDNPDMTDEQIAFSIQAMKEYGIVDSGDTLTKGIGAMTDARFKSFFDKMVKAKVVAPTVDYTKAYTLAFVNKGVGLDLKKP